jgi:hypothetical protein
MQSLFSIGGKHVLPESVTWLNKNVGGRIPVSVAASKFKQYLTRNNLNNRFLFVYIEEALVASSESLVAVKSILQATKNPFCIFAVGHPLQELRESTTVRTNGKFSWTEYETPSYLPARYSTQNSVHLEPSIFTNQDNWKVNKYVLTQNMRQQGTQLGLLLNKCTKETVTTELLSLFKENKTITILANKDLNKYILKQSALNCVYLTPSKQMQDRINSVLSTGAVAYYPYITMKQYKGYVKSFKDGLVTLLDNTTFTVPTEFLSSFTEVWSSLTVPAANYLKVSDKVIFRQVYRYDNTSVSNGTKGVIIHIDKTNLTVRTENGDTVIVKYTPCHIANNAYTLAVLPIMSQVSLTTSKVQGWTAAPEQTVIVVIDGDNEKPKPHAYYVGLSRARSIEKLKIIITTNQESINTAQVLDSILKFEDTAISFYKNEDEVQARLSELKLKKQALLDKIAELKLSKVTALAVSE